MLAARVTASDASSVTADALVVLAVGDRILANSGTLTTGQRKQLLTALAAVSAGPDVTRLPGSVISRPGVVLVSRVGDPVTQEGIRRAVGSAVRELTAGAVAVIAPDASPDTVAAVVQGACLGSYRYDRYRANPGVSKISVLISETVSREVRAAAKNAHTIAEGVGLARDLVNTPPNDLGPADFAEIARHEAEGTDIAVKIWDDRALRRGGFGGLVAVGQGSVRSPRLVRLSYRPSKPRRSVALVGKGITFDSGGLSLKPAKSMEWMKADMGGAAAVLATVLTAARLKLPISVTGWLALAENMPSGTAQRPGDVITIRGGTTVEVLNTDAEGRLVLADALMEAAADHPDLIIDIATLTGAQLIALGARVGGAMGNDDDQRASVVAAAEAAGESLWPMPLPPELRPSLDSTVADLANIGDRNGGMLTAALFLSEFVPAETPWTHLDIAGPAFNEGQAHDYTPKGGTGFGVRTLVRFLQDLS